MKTAVHSAPKIVIYWLLTGCILIYAMVVIGGLTRLTHSGLSMVNWSIFGSTPPVSDQDWLVLFSKYQNYPEYQQVNFNISVNEFKHIFWWEYSHRLLGRTIGFLFIFPFLFFWWKGYFSGPLLKRLLVIVLLGALQGALGWYMVKSGLSKEPRVSHFRLAAHLLSAFTVFGFTFWTALTLILPANASSLGISRRPRTLVLLGIGFLALVVFQILYGAFVAGLHAGLLCPTWPSMCGEWMPDAVSRLTPLTQNLLYNPACIQWVHRCTAFLVVLFALLLYIKTRLFTRQVKRAVQFIALLVVVQFTLGVLTLLNGVPVVLGILHQTGAFFLFASTLYLLYVLNCHSQTKT